MHNHILILIAKPVIYLPSKNFTKALIREKDEKFRYDLVYEGPDQIFFDIKSSMHSI